MKPIFRHFEEVRISDDSSIADFGIGGKCGVILGISEDETDQFPTSYAVKVDQSELIMIEERLLTSTGRLMSREDFYDGSSIRVSKDGHLLDD